MSHQTTSMILLGAVAGDIIGSRFEWHPTKSEIFPLLNQNCHFTDDSVLTLAVADALLDGKNYQQKILQFAQLYPVAGYGRRFRKWMHTGGDADTLAAISGAIAEAYYGAVPTWLEEKIRNFLSPHLWNIIVRFNQKFRNNNNS